MTASALWAPARTPHRTGSTVAPHLAALLGRTRAAVLITIAEHPLCTTTQLAARTKISPASASEHATVLRKAGLTTLTRNRKQVQHSISPSGLTLLNTTTD